MKHSKQVQNAYKWLKRYQRAAKGATTRKEREHYADAVRRAIWQVTYLKQKEAKANAILFERADFLASVTGTERFAQ